MIMDTVKICNQTFYNTYINLKDKQNKTDMVYSLAILYRYNKLLLGVLKMFDYVDQGISIFYRLTIYFSSGKNSFLSCLNVDNNFCCGHCKPSWKTNLNFKLHLLSCFQTSAAKMKTALNMLQYISSPSTI